MFKVLLVDDEYMILEGLQFIIPWQELGFEIVGKVRSGQEALTFLGEHKVDLVISDITMPGMTGLAMVDEAERRGYKFLTIFLTGYQEFEFVREGMRLGAKAYLVKPVNRQELIEDVQKSYQELFEQTQREEQEHLLFDAKLRHWLNDEANELEYLSLMNGLHLSTAGPFTAIKIYSHEAILKEIVEGAQAAGQKLWLLDNLVSVPVLIMVYLGKKNNLSQFLAGLNRKWPTELEIFLGETVQDWENLYESYEKILQLEELNSFYPELLPQTSMEQSMMQNEGELSFFAFNKSLMIGDSKTIHDELEKIFTEVAIQQVQPEYARYIAFLLFADIARQYPTVTQEIYDETIKKIRTQETLAALHEVIEDVLAQVSQLGPDKPYSEVTQKVVNLVKADYQQELTIKMVADTLHLNGGYLGQLFKKEIHHSFSQYLNQVRIKKAQQLLLHSTLNINEISDEIGYNNTNYFSKMFKKLNGLTPKEFRDQFASNYSDLTRDDF